MGGRIELDSQNGWTLFTLVLAADADVQALVGVERLEQLRARENGRRFHVRCLGRTCLRV